MTGIVSFPTQAYLWVGEVDHPYGTPEERCDQAALRKWQAAVVRDRIRQQDGSPCASATALTWARCSWRAIEKELRHLPGHSKLATPKTPYGRHLSLSYAWLLLQMPETPALLRREHRTAHLPLRYAAPIEVQSLAGRAPEELARVLPRALTREAWPAWFPLLPFPKLAPGQTEALLHPGYYDLVASSPRPDGRGHHVRKKA